ncbi:transporter [Rhizobium sp. CCGE 510]|uniref:SphA family protein n=1 Tax=Rhizobium sp. CCGE 510 TaxID=1132836 RepID=UPI00027B890F|nr:transporter [Rhizobium sp. CCGE 510]EJT01965.1 hypothetical protein RCCGE510_25721 [Rhizobium sp. CCGE 510]
MRYNLKTSTLAIILAASAAPVAMAAEGGAGFYLLGSKTVGAGFTPPPGVFFSNDIYLYSGDLGGNQQLPAGGRLAVGVEGKAAIDVPTALWILPEELMGARPGLLLSVPFGWKETSADVTLAGPRGGVATGSVTDPVFTVGDPIVGGLLGWEAGNFHWQIGTLVNVPIGDYQDGEISNVAFHHWGADVSGSFTWLDPSIGLDLSATVGMTFNAENPATDYRTGNEFHFEWAAVQHFNEQFDAGLVGYYYDQVTGDSGAGARSDFKGRVAAIGATIGWTFKAGEVPISTRIKYFHEFAAENRAEGDAVFLTVSMPLAITKPVSAQ